MQCAWVCGWTEPEYWAKQWRGNHTERTKVKLRKQKSSFLSEWTHYYVNGHIWIRGWQGWLVGWVSLWSGLVFVKMYVRHSAVRCRGCNCVSFWDTNEVNRHKRQLLAASLAWPGFSRDLAASHSRKPHASHQSILVSFTNPQN